MDNAEETIPMWNQNELTEKLDITYPILLAPMAEFVSPEIAAAVSNAGGLGSLGMWGFTLEEGRARIEKFRQLSDGAININYPLWDASHDLANLNLPMQHKIQQLYDEQGIGQLSVSDSAGCQVFPDHMAVLKEVRPELVSFHFGLPDSRTVDELKSSGISVLSSATTVWEAVTLERCGVDFIIAQGMDAGGHRGTFDGTDISMQSGLFSLLPQVVDAVDVPVIAAGGIFDGRGIAAALMLGASGVQIGTAFLVCDEANVDEDYFKALTNAREGTTLVTDSVSGRNARFIRNRLVEELNDSGLDPLPFPAQYGATLPLGESGDYDYMDLIAGQSVAAIRPMSAGEFIRTLVEETGNSISSFQ